MSTVRIDEKDVFNTARQIGDAGARANYLQAACRDNPAALSRIGDLLRVHEHEQSFLESPAAAYFPTVSESAISEVPGTVIGPYKLLEQIGEGGFGVVFMAEQLYPVRRKVAVKLLKPGMDTRQVIARFEAERQALALMDHPNIARILDAGTTGGGDRSQEPGVWEERTGATLSPGSYLQAPAAGRPYFVMELVKGVPITEYCDQQRLATRERLKLFVDVCHAVQHAHQKGIIHRDLKPSNVLVTIQDGRPLVKVIDFGIAKAMGQQLTDRTLFTGFAQLIGTPLYMSPEQAALSAVDVDTRSDVYSLGVLLYELLTGTTPFDKECLSNASYDELRRIIREDEPPRPSARISTLGHDARSTVASRQQVEPQKLGHQLRGELDWIVMRALEKDRNRRYESANSLVADVERYLNDEAVQACPPSAWYRLRKLARRNRALFMTATVISVALLVAMATLAVSSVLVWRAKADLQEALKREQIDSYFHRIALAHRELSENNLGRALELLEECPPKQRDWEWHYLRRLCQVDPLTLHGHGQGIRGVAISPEGNRLATANDDGTIGLFDVESGAELPSLIGHTGKVRSLAFDPQGARLASTGADRTVNVWDLSTGQIVYSLAGNSGVHGGANGVAFSPDGRLLAAGSEGGSVLLCSALDGRVLQRLGPHEAFAVAMAFSPDSRLLATGSWNGVLRIWDAETGRLLHEKQGDGRALSSMSFRPDGRRLATAGYDRLVRLWDPATGELLQSWRAHDCIILGLSFCPPNGSRLATIGGEDKTVKLWDASTGREVLKLRGHTYFGGCVVFSPDGRRLASSDHDGTIRIWDASAVDHGPELATLRHDDEVWNVAFSPDGRYIASAGFDQTARLWDPDSGMLLHRLSHPSQVYQVAFNRDGRCLVTVSRDKTARIWEAATGRQRTSFTTPNEHLYGVTYSPDGRYVVVDDVGGHPIPVEGHHAITVWDVHTNPSAPSVIGIIGRHQEDIWCLKFSPDGESLASASNDGTVKVWRWDPAHLGEPAAPLRTFSIRNYGYGECAAFTPDGNDLVGAAGEMVKIWDLHTAEELPPLHGHNGQVNALAVSPDGDWLASAGEDTTIVLWNARTWERRHTLRGHTGMVMSLAFSPDSRRLVSGSRDKTVKVWDMTRWDRGPDR